MSKAEFKIQSPLQKNLLRAEAQNLHNQLENDGLSANKFAAILDRIEEINSLIYDYEMRQKRIKNLNFKLILGGKS